MKVFIIHSEKLDKYYVGSTQDIVVRLYKHNTGASKFTKKGIPWTVVTRKSLKGRISLVSSVQSQIKEEAFTKQPNSKDFYLGLSKSI